ncbi:MAG: phasin family protein [Anaerolineaceae bacterium]
MTTKSTNKSEAEEGTERRRSLFDITRKVMLASIGAMAIAQDELEDFIQRLVERGEIEEKEGTSLIHELKTKQKQKIDKGEEEIQKRVNQLLKHVDIPTKSDLETLNQKISNLSKKIDDLKREQK